MGSSMDLVVMNMGNLELGELMKISNLLELQ